MGRRFKNFGIGGFDLHRWTNADIFAADDNAQRIAIAIGYHFGAGQNAGTLLNSGDLIGSESCSRSLSGFPKCSENKEQAQHPDTHSNYRGLSHDPRPDRHGLLRFEVILAALGFAFGIGFSAYALLLGHRGDSGGFAFNGYTGGLCILLSLFLCLEANLIV